MITRLIIAGLLFVTLTSGLAFANDPEPPADTVQPAVTEPAPEQPEAQPPPP